MSELAGTTSLVSPPPLPPVKVRPRRRWLTVLLALVIFGAGFTVGGTGAAVYVVYRFRYALRHPDELPDRLATRLGRRLGLSATQEEQVRAIFEARQSRLRKIRGEFQPQVENELRGVHGDVGEVLTAAQRAKWDAMYEDLIRNWMPPAVGQ